METKISDISLQKIVAELRSKNEQLRNRAAKQIRNLVERTSRERSGESFASFIDELNAVVHELVNSREASDRIGAIMAIDKLINLNYDDPRKISRFSNYLRNTLTNQHSDAPTIEMVTKSLGRLAKASSSTTSKTLTAEWVEFESKRALEWLEGDMSKHKDDGKKYAAVLVLKELAENAPTLFYAHVATFLSHVWNGLRDMNHLVREGSQLALRAVLVLISERRSTVRVEWYHNILDQVRKGTKQKVPEIFHGALLALAELLRNTGGFMMELFEEVCNIVVSNTDHGNKLVRKSVLQLIPICAVYYQQQFIDKYLSKTVQLILINVSKVNPERPTAYEALGDLAVEVGSAIAPYKDQIIQVIKEALGNASKRTKPFAPEALTALAKLGTALGDIIQRDVVSMLDLIFGNSLTTVLTDALNQLVEKIPSLLKPVQERLLEIISLILAIAPFTPVNTKHILPQVEPAKDLNEQTISLALKTLGTFDMQGHNLIDFVHDRIMLYLEVDNHQIRKEAAKTCCKLLVDQGKPPIRGHYGGIVSEVLEKLLTLGVTDSDFNIRYTVLSSLDYRFDHFLAFADNLRFLFIALNDEHFATREVAISIIGRLSTQNPAYVLPSLRKSLLQLLTEVEFSEDSRCKEESARMLGHLITSAPHLIKPYVSSILNVLTGKIRDPNPLVSTWILDTLGKLSLVGGVEIMQFMDILLPLVIETLSDQSSSSKRVVAVRTLGQLIESTGFVIVPYIKFPKLLSILLTILKTEEEWSARREVIKVLGIIGAIDPYKHSNLLQLTAADKPTTLDNQIDIAPAISPSSEEYYPTVVFSSLMRILNDSSLSNHHYAVIHAVMFIFTSLGLKCVQFLPQVMPPFLQLIRNCETSIRNPLFQQLSLLVSIVKQHIRNYLTEIFSLIKDFWKSDLKVQLIGLVEDISLSLNEEFKSFLPEVLPQIITVLQHDKSAGQVNAIKSLRAIVVFGQHLEDYLYLVIPAIVRLFEHPDACNDLKTHAIRTIAKLSKKLYFAEYSSRIIHPLSRVLYINHIEIRTRAMQCLCYLVCQLGTDFTIFAPMIRKVLTENHIVFPKYEDLVSKAGKALPLQEPVFHDDDDSSLPGPEDASLTEVKMHVNQTNLRRAWEASQRSTKEDWIEWIRGFSVELLRESPSPALRSCFPLAQVYHPLARELFNAGFVSCWTELDDKEQGEVVRALEIAFSSPNLPPEVLQTLLNLAEFMEHDEKPLPIAISALGALAEKCQCYAKALHYKEIEFHENPGSLIEDLISINNQLQQHEAAMGILKYAQKNHSIELKESWYEKLQRWEEAYQVYEQKQKQQPNALPMVLGRMRCLKAMGEWEKLLDVSKQTWEQNGKEFRVQIAPMAAAAAWNLSQWSFMEDCVRSMEEITSESLFFKAILAIHNNEFELAHTLIDETREMLDRELTALVSESYNRAYDVIVRVQQLSEMEEIIRYKQLTDQNSMEQRNTIRKIWTDRLKGVRPDVDHWHNILSVRRIVIPAEDDVDVWLKFASLCRRANKLQLSQKTLAKLVKGFNPIETPEMLLTTTSTKVAYQYFKHLRCDPEKKQLAMELLTKFVQSNSAVQGNQKLLARCFLTMGIWQQQGITNYEEIQINEILENMKTASQLDPSWYKAWHSWAMMNSEAVSHYEKNKAKSGQMSTHLVSALQGFFRSISLSPDHNSSLQDILRLLTLWFKHGAKKEVEMTLIDGFNTVKIDTWLEVIPQIIARVNSNILPIQNLIQDLLVKVGKAHPHFVIYPLTVCSKSQSPSRRDAAEAILSKMRLHSPVLVEQALMVSNELIRVAILWNELWHEGLEEASRLYFGEHDVKGMFSTLEPLHKMMNKPETLSESSFQQTFGRDLAEAFDWCQKYKRSGKEAELQQAWDLYYHVFRRINKQLTSMVKLELQYVSPKLLEAQNLELAVPGTYRSDTMKTVCISSFARTLKVLFTKQRPRKLKIFSVDGHEYQFLLKGHEDLRQDERVMQLFGLVNTLLANDPETSTRDLSIKRYAVIPLSNNAGLIGWVDNCDTLHSLIKEYRESRNILLNIEHRLMLQMAPDYDNLSLMQKIEVFEHALENTTGQDLYKVLWLKSRSSEIWLYRRTNYIRSLAVMSMVGYILGLGDRHPSNIMLEKLTGKVVHIDFGDCFEVAMHREKFPEKIPFRLTRMLVNAMEVCGIEGTFRATAESVMRVLRKHKDSVMAMLEAFVYDPLINWRLLEAANNEPSIQPNQPHTPSQSQDEAQVMGSLTSAEEQRHYPSRSVREKELRKNIKKVECDDEDELHPETLNKRALNVINRVANKLNGRDFEEQECLATADQVQRLIEQATCHANLAQCYIGWCAFW